MYFIKNTSPKYVQVQFLAQQNAQKRAQNVQEEETGLSTEEYWHSNSANRHFHSTDWHRLLIGPKCN